MISKYDAWLQAPYYEDSGSELIEERTWELLKTPDYDPLDLYHLSEAISEAKESDAETLRDLAEQKNWTEFGRKIYCLSFAYYEKFAQAQAIDEFNNGDLGYDD